MTQFLILLSIHYVADFIVQTDWQAQNKSRDSVALIRHVGTYMVCIAVAVGAMFPYMKLAGVIFCLVNFFAHLATDYVTSRLSVSQPTNRRRFFVIGADQLIHQLTLGITLIYIMGVSS